MRNWGSGSILAVAVAAAVFLASSPGVDVVNADVPSAEPEVISVSDASLADAPQVDVSGEIVVSIVEANLETNHDRSSGEPHEDPSTVEYAIVSDSGVLIPIDDDLPDDVGSGDQFAGAIAVAPEVTDLVSDAASDALDSSSSAAPVEGDSIVGDEILEAAADAELPASISEGSITVMESAVTTTVANHELTIVVVKPTGVAAGDQVDQRYSDASITAVASEAAAFWTSSLIPTFSIAPTIVKQTSTSSCSQNYSARWSSAASALGYASTQAFLTAAPAGTVRHLMVLLPPACESSQPPGVGTVGYDLHSGGLSQVVMGIGVDLQVMTHELGHNMSLGHSSLDFCGVDAVSIGCTFFEYGDFYDVMGYALTGEDSGIAVLNGRSQITTGIQTLDPANRLTLPGGTPSQTWDITVKPLSDSDPDSYYVIDDPVSGDEYHLEYRAAEPAAFYAQGYQFTIGTRVLQLGAGLRLLRDDADGGSEVIAIPSSGNSFRASASTGQVVRNASSSIQVTFVSGGPSTGANVQVSVTLPSTADVMPVYRFWSPQNQTHFFTMNEAERASVEANYPDNIWTFEGERFLAFDTPGDGRVPLYRFWSPMLSGHFFTTNESEKNQIIAKYPPSVWTYENIAFYVYPTNTTVPNTMTVARFWSPTNQHHFYTANASEREVVKTSYPSWIWTYEGDNFRVPAAQP